ncbi:MAG: hypothetical protein Q8R53_04860 [Nanoarchaeota archaeon]|nr:hypothetical protein [Nanoarchaeota archaeon]
MIRTLELIISHESAPVHEPIFLELLEDIHRGPKILSVHRLLYKPKKERRGDKEVYLLNNMRTVAYIYDCRTNQLQSMCRYLGNFKDPRFRWTSENQDRKPFIPGEQDKERFGKYLQRVLSGLQEQQQYLQAHPAMRTQQERENYQQLIPLVERIMIATAKKKAAKSGAVIP